MSWYLFFMSMRFAGIPYHLDAPGVVRITICDSQTIGMPYDGTRLYPYSTTCAYVDGVMIAMVDRSKEEPMTANERFQGSSAFFTLQRRAEDTTFVDLPISENSGGRDHTGPCTLNHASFEHEP